MGIVIGLLVGTGAGYFYGQSPIAGYKEEIQNLETENISLGNQREQLQGELTSIQDQVDSLTANLTENLSSLKDLQTEFSKITTEYESLQLSHSELEGEYGEIQRLYSVLEQEYDSLKLSYETINEDYDKLRECIPPGVGILYSELKKSPEGYSRNELIGICGQDYLIPAPINADTWEVNITVISELSWQPVHIWIYTVYEDYPPDWLGQPFAPYARGDGEVSISLTLNISYAYVLRVRDAYAKPFTGFIEENWYLNKTEKSNFLKNGGLDGCQEETTWLPPYWDGGGYLGRTGAGFIGNASRLYSWAEGRTDPWCTQFWQDVQVNVCTLELAFWVSANPRGENITLVVTLGDQWLFNWTWFGEWTDWRKISVIFSTEPGLHRLSFKILGVKDYTRDTSPFVVVDEVSLMG